MVTPSPGVVVVVRFPFSDLSAAKYRPAVVLAAAGGPEWILCQVTSNPYADTDAVPLHGDSFVSGGLDGTGYARPGKVFTASESIVTALAGRLKPAAHREIVEAVIRLLGRGLLT